MEKVWLELLLAGGGRSRDCSPGWIFSATSDGKRVYRISRSTRVLRLSGSINW